MCVYAVAKVYVCDEFSGVTAMLTSGDRLMDDGEGVGLSGCHHASQTEQTQSFRHSAKSHTTYESDDITVLDA
jgi:hypothetical protein